MKSRMNEISLILLTTVPAQNAPGRDTRAARKPKKDMMKLNKHLLMLGAIAAVLGSAPLRANYVWEVTQDNPVSYWRLGESSGATANDLMGHNNGSYSGTY